MKILYISCFPNDYMNQAVEKCRIIPSQAAQKFNMLFVNGFQKNDCDVDVLITQNYLKHDIGGFFIRKEKLVENGINYYFIPSVKPVRIGLFMEAYSISSFVKKWIAENPDGLIVYDYLKPNVKTVAKTAKKYDFSNVSIITDLYEPYRPKSDLISKFKLAVRKARFNKILDCASHYIFLTEQMNEKLNPKHKKYRVIEGLVDIEQGLCDEKTDKYEKKVCLYSGSLNARYGIEMLIEAFIKSKVENSELHLYGSGDYEEQIKNICLRYPHIKYFGLVKTETVVEVQKKATLLINPRPSFEDFTKYSFPSKNMEYMLSGTPVLTTKLPGMPNEYLDFVYIIETENVDGLAQSIRNILSKTGIELDLKGAKAKEFVLLNKNNKIQAKQILDLVQKSTNDIPQRGDLQ